MKEPELIYDDTAEYLSPAPNLTPSYKESTAYMYSEVQKHDPSSPEWDRAYETYESIHRREWAQALLPNARLETWDEEDLDKLFSLISQHVCGVCGRWDDPGCTYNC